MDRRLLRILIASLAVLLAFSLIYRAQLRRSALQEVSSRWDQSGITLRHPEARLAANRQTDPVWADLALARALLSDSLDLGRLATLSTDQAEREAIQILQRLAVAQQLAGDALVRRPTAWEAATILGGTRLLARLASDQDPIRQAVDWEEPLELAQDLSPRAIEPRRLQAISSLTRWHALSDDERTRAASSIQQLLADPESLRLLLPGWMAISDRDTLFDSLPDSTPAWSRVADELARQGRWADHCEASAEWSLLLHRELEATLEEALLRRAGGDSIHARRRFVEVIQRSQPSRSSADLFDRALTELPPGPLNPSSAPALRAWADWGLALWLIEQPTLSKAAFRRLGGLEDLLPPEVAASASLAAGELDRAQRIEQRHDESWSEAWGPYLLGKAKVLDEMGRPDEARASLDQVHRSFRTDPTFRTIAVRLGLAPEPLDRPNGEMNSWWPATAWAWSGPRVSLTVDLSRDPIPLDFDTLDGSTVPDATLDRRTLELFIDLIQPAESPIELQWDGEDLGCRTVAAGDPMALEVDLSPRLHRLLITQRVRGSLQPGMVRLGSLATPPLPTLAAAGTSE